jgi:hypothetical protein
MIAAVTLLLSSCGGARMFLVSRDPNNDVVRLLKNTASAERVSDAASAIGRAGPGDAVLLLADGYPTARTAVPWNLSLAARARGFRAYVEFPDQAAPATALSWKQRAVVTSSDLAAHGLGELRILQLMDPVAVDWCGGSGCARPRAASCELACNGTLVSFAQVAGVDSATFGVTDAERAPLLCRNGTRVLVSASKLSCMVSGRYA